MAADGKDGQDGKGSEADLQHPCVTPNSHEMGQSRQGTGGAPSTGHGLRSFLRIFDGFSPPRETPGSPASSPSAAPPMRRLFGPSPAYRLVKAAETNPVGRRFLSAPAPCHHHLGPKIRLSRHVSPQLGMRRSSAPYSLTAPRRCPAESGEQHVGGEVVYRIGGNYGESSRRQSYTYLSYTRPPRPPRVPRCPPTIPL